mgnify:CR=1 FL=1
MSDRTIIIAEAGVNHNGSMEMAKAMVDVAADAGVDYIKFQTFKSELLVTSQAQQADYQKKQAKRSHEYGQIFGFRKRHGLSRKGLWCRQGGHGGNRLYHCHDRLYRNPHRSQLHRTGSGTDLSADWQLRHHP